MFRHTRTNVALTPLSRHGRQRGLICHGADRVATSRRRELNIDWDEATRYANEVIPKVRAPHDLGDSSVQRFPGSDLTRGTRSDDSRSERPSSGRSRWGWHAIRWSTLFDSRRYSHGVMRSLANFVTVGGRSGAGSSFAPPRSGSVSPSPQPNDRLPRRSPCRSSSPGIATDSSASTFPRRQGHARGPRRSPDSTRRLRADSRRAAYRQYNSLHHLTNPGAGVVRAGSRRRPLD
ncbi:MAG: hypothetical protein K0Q89_951 [Thermomicrobiales bacterium]|nr:hypothetical protein [Thermomicrobiales bacterium]